MNAGRSATLGLDTVESFVMWYAFEAGSRGPFTEAELLTAFPFLRYALADEGLTRLLKSLEEKGYLDAVGFAENTRYEPSAKTSPAAIVADGSLKALVFDNAGNILKRIPLSAFVELDSVKGDAGLASLRSDARLGPLGWWHQIVTLAEAYEAVRTEGRRISVLIRALAACCRVSLAGDPDMVYEQADRAWLDDGIARFPIDVERLTPWRDMAMQALVVRIESFAPRLRTRLLSLDMEALVREQREASIVIGIGDPVGLGGRLFDSLGSMVRLTSWDLKRIATAKKTAEEFREIIREKIDIRLISPYTAKGPVGPETFRGRDYEIRKIVGRPMTNFAVYGNRQMGKTSLLRALQRTLTGSRKTVFLDCGLLETEEAFSQALSKHLGLEVCRSLDEIVLRIGDVERGSVVLLDEIDPFLDAVDAKRVLTALRSISNQAHVQFVVAGWDQLHTLSMRMGGPMFNLMEPVLLEPLKEKEAISLAQDPMADLGVWYDREGTIRQLVNCASRIPSLIQIMCQDLVEILNEEQTRTITGEMVRMVFDGDPFRSSVAEVLFLNLSGPQRVVLLAGLRAKEMPFSEICQRVQQECPSLRQDDIRSILRELEVCFILERRRNTYAHTYEHMPALLQRTINVEDALREAAAEVEWERGGG